MIKRILLSISLIIFGGILTMAAQTDTKLSAQISLHISIFEKLDEPSKSKFKTEVNIFAALEFTNESSEEIGMIVGQEWRYLRPKLISDGKIVPYKTEIQQLLKEGSPVYSPLIQLTLKPKTPTTTDNVQLDYWYDKLEPGHYTITVERMWVNQTLISNQVEFDIVP